MFDFYAWATPNGRKIAIMFAETELPHEVRPIDIGQGEQHEPAFLAVSPNNKIPAIVHHRQNGGSLSMFESGAILTYLADVAGMLLPGDDARWIALEWLHWSIGGLGPMVGQLNYFANGAEKANPDAIDRYRLEVGRLIGVLERRLATTPYIAGDDYTIADIVSFPWLAAARTKLASPLADAFASAPALDAWHRKVAAKPAVQQGMAILADRVKEGG